MYIDVTICLGKYSSGADLLLLYKGKKIGIAFGFNQVYDI